MISLLTKRATCKKDNTPLRDKYCPFCPFKGKAVTCKNVDAR